MVAKKRNGSIKSSATSDTPKSGDACKIRYSDTKILVVIESIYASELGKNIKHELKYPIDVSFRVTLGDEVLGISEFYTIPDKEEHLIDYQIVYTLPIEPSQVLVSQPLTVTVFGSANTKEKGTKSSSRTNTRTSTKQSDVKNLQSLVQANTLAETLIDLLPLVFGEREIEQRADFIEVLARLDGSPLKVPTNLLYVTVQSLYNPPSTLISSEPTSTTVLIRTLQPFEDTSNKTGEEEWSKLKFSAGIIMSTDDVREQPSRRWFSVHAGSPLLSQYRNIPDEIRTRDPHKLVADDYDRSSVYVTWNQINRVLLEKHEEIKLISNLVENGEWVLEIFGKKPTEKKHGKAVTAEPVKLTNEALLETPLYHVKLDVSELLHPGVNCTRIVAPLRDLQTSSDVLSMQHFSSRTLMSQLSKEEEVSNLRDDSGNVVDALGRTSYITVLVELYTSFRPRKTTEEILSSVSEFVRARTDDCKIANDEINSPFQAQLRYKTAVLDNIHYLNGLYEEFNSKEEDFISLKKKKSKEEDFLPLKKKNSKEEDFLPLKKKDSKGEDYLSLKKKNSKEEDYLSLKKKNSKEEDVLLLKKRSSKDEDFLPLKNSKEEEFPTEKVPVDITADNNLSDDMQFKQELIKSGAMDVVNQSMQEAISCLVRDTCTTYDIKSGLSEMYCKIVEETQGVLREASKVEPSGPQIKATSDELLEAAREASEDDNYQAAEQFLLKRLYYYGKKDASKWRDMAVLNLRHGDTSRAKQVLMVTLCLQPRNRDALLMLAVLFANEGNYNDATLFFEALTTFYPRFYKGWFAYFCFFESIENKQGSDVCLSLGSVCLTDKERDEGEIGSCYWSLDIINTEMDGFILTAIYLLSLNLYQFAEICLSQHKLDAGEETLAYLYYLSVAHHIQEKFKESNSHLKEAISISWNDERLWNLMGHNLYRINDWDRAVDCYQLILDNPELLPQNSLTYYRMGNIQLSRGDYEQAAKYFLKSVSTCSSLQSWIGLAKASYWMGNFDDAELAAREANRLDDKASDPWACLALINYRNCTQPELARQCLSIATQCGQIDEELMKEINAVLDIYEETMPEFPSRASKKYSSQCKQTKQIANKENP